MTVLSKKVIESICRHLSVGNYLETAASAVGVSRVTLNNWMHEARDAKRLQRQGKRLTPRQSLALELFDKAEIAMAKGEVRDLGTIDNAATNEERPQWQAAAWKLERRFPERWGRKDAVAVQGRVEHDHKHSLDEAMLKLLGMVEATGPTVVDAEVIETLAIEGPREDDE